MTNSKLNSVKFIKMKRVDVPVADQDETGIIAFQAVKFFINYFGSEIETILDTKIMKNGVQTVIDGNGFIPDGTLIN